MATVTVDINKLVRTNEPSEAVTPASFSANDTVKVPFTEKNVIVVITASASGNIVVSKGTGIAGVADKTFAVTSGKATAIQLDSSAYEAIDGANKGYAILTPAVGGTLVAVNGL